MREYVGKKTRDNRRTIGNAGSNTQPFSGSPPQSSNRRSDKREDEDRNKEIEEVTKESIEGGEYAAKPFRRELAHHHAKDDGDDDTE